MIKREYGAVDIAKLFFCFCILFRHTGAYHEIPFSYYFQHGLFCLAVPFFFVTSGYFFGIKAKADDGVSMWDKVKKYEKRLLYPYIAFSIINIFMAAYDLLKSGESIKWTILRMGRSVLFYPYGALWYVWASMTGVLILYLFLRKGKLKLALFMGVLVYLFALLCNSYYFVSEGTLVRRVTDIYLWITTSARNGLFVGFPLLTLGTAVAWYEEKILQYLKGKRLLFVAIMSWLIMFGEILFIQNKTTADDHSLFIMQLVFIPALLLLLIQCNCRLSHEKAVLCRNLSTGIYFIHRPVLSIMRKIIAAVGIVDVSGVLQFLILSVFCVMVCLVVNISKKEPFYSLLR